MFVGFQLRGHSIDGHWILIGFSLDVRWIPVASDTSQGLQNIVEIVPDGSRFYQNDSVYTNISQDGIGHRHDIFGLD